METNKNKYVAVAYKLYATDEDGRGLVEEATVEKPFQFITGFGIVLDDFEKTVGALEKGETFDINIDSAHAYGEYSDERVLNLDREIFTINGHFDYENIRKNAMVPLQNESGKRFMGRVVDITDDKVVMDLNHPLAGMDLNFVGSIVESREATNDEIQGMINRLSGEGCCCGCEGDDHCGCHDDHHDCHGEHHHKHGGCCGHH